MDDYDYFFNPLILSTLRAIKSISAKVGERKNVIYLYS